METVTDLIFGDSKIIADGDCSHEIKRHLLLRRNDQPRQHIKKQRHYFANNIVKVMVFPVVMYGCELDHKKAECWRIDAFELWRRCLRVPWIARRSNQSILKEISPKHSLKGLMLKLKMQYFGHLMHRADSLEKTLMLGKIKRMSRRGWQIASSTQWTWVWANSMTW